MNNLDKRIGDISKITDGSLKIIILCIFIIITVYLFEMFTNIIPNDIYINISFIMHIIFAIVIFIISILHMIRFTYNKKKLIPVEYSLPDNITPCDAGYLYYKKVTKRQIISLIPYLISKGIFSIFEKEGKIYIKKNYEIPIKEELIVKKAFMNSFDDADEIELKNFKMNGYDVIKILKQNFKQKLNMQDKRVKFIYNGFLFVVLLLPFTTKYIYPENYNNLLIIISIISGILLIITNLLKTKNIELEDEQINLVKGYRIYLKEVEKEKIELLFKENPSLFYKELSYAYSLGVTDTWVEELNNIEYFDVSTIDFDIMKK